MLNDELVKKLEAKERKRFKVSGLTKWQDELQKSVTARGEWEIKAKECDKVRTNDLPILDSELLADYEGKHYVNNQLHQINTLKVSSMIGGDVFMDVKPTDGYRSQHVNNLEAEMNYAFCAMNGDREVRASCTDMFWYGRGVGRTIVDDAGADSVWINGKPRFERVDPFRSFIDHATPNQDFSKMRWHFIVDTIDVELLREQFPDKTHLINKTGSTATNVYTSPTDTEDLTNVITCQYKRVEKIPHITITDMNSGEYWEYTKDEFDKNKEQLLSVENVGISKVYTKAVDAWYQFMWIDGTNNIIDEPTYIGRRSNYSFINGEKLNQDPYTVGMTSLLIDMQDASIILFTAMVVLTAKMGRQIPVMYEGAFTNQDDIDANSGKINQRYIVNEDWAKENPELRAIEFIDSKADISPALTLVSLLNTAISGQMGANDAVQGKGRSGQSGSAINALKDASGIYHQKEQKKIHEFIGDIGTVYADSIIYYNDHEHTIQGLSVANKIEQVEVNTNIYNQLKDFGFYVKGFTHSNDEQQKQVERQEAMVLFNLGLLSGEALMSKFDIPRPQYELDKAREESGMKQVMEVIQRIPALKEYILSLDENAQSIGKLGGAGVDVSKMVDKKQ